MVSLPADQPPLPVALVPLPGPFYLVYLGGRVVDVRAPV